jgi:hypothetical protein
MKKIAFAFAALMLSSASHSAQRYEATGENGSAIVLTNRDDGCAKKQGSDRFRSGYFITHTGKMVFGCWTVMDDRIAMLYDDGDVRMYNANIFELVGEPDKKEQPAKSKKQYQSM